MWNIRITEPVKYLYTSGAAGGDILKNIAQSCIRTVIASYNVDEVLTTGKGEIQSRIKEMILKSDGGTGSWNSAWLISQSRIRSRLQQEVMKAFKAVETAKQGKETALE